MADALPRWLPSYRATCLARDAAAYAEQYLNQANPVYFTVHDKKFVLPKIQIVLGHKYQQAQSARWSTSPDRVSGGNAERGLALPVLGQKHRWESLLTISAWECPPPF